MKTEKEVGVFVFLPLCFYHRLTCRGGYHPLRRTVSNCTLCLYKPSPVGGGGPPHLLVSAVEEETKVCTLFISIYSSSQLFRLSYFFALRVGRTRTLVPYPCETRHLRIGESHFVLFPLLKNPTPLTLLQPKHKATHANIICP